MKRILVVEDEAAIREMVALNLKRAGWDVLEAPQRRARAGTAARRTLRCGPAGHYAARMDGLSLCETIRRDNADIGIIIVSAKGQEQDKIRGLSIGATTISPSPSRCRS